MFYQHGIPECLFTNNATIFNSKMFNDMCFQWRVRHVNISPYYQPNLAEQFNRNLKFALIVFNHDRQIPWDKELYTLQMGFHLACHEATKSTLATLLLGKELNYHLQWELNIEDLHHKGTLRVSGAAPFTLCVK